MACGVTNLGVVLVLFPPNTEERPLFWAGQGKPWLGLSCHVMSYQGAAVLCLSLLCLLRMHKPLKQHQLRLP